MFFLKSILFQLLFLTISFAETIEISSFSSSFTIDTVFPEIELLEPGHGDIYEHDDLIEVSWIASDQSPGDTPISIHATPFLNSPYQQILTNLGDLGSFGLPAPEFINSMFVSIRLDLTLP